MARHATITLLSFVGVHIALILGAISLSTHYWIKAEPPAANHSMSNTTAKNSTMKNTTTTVLSYSKGLWKICYENTTTVDLYHNKTIIIHHNDTKHHNTTNHTMVHSTKHYREEKCFDVGKFNRSAWEKLLPANHTNHTKPSSDMKTLGTSFTVKPTVPGMKTMVPAKPINHTTTVDTVLKFIPVEPTTRFPIIHVQASNKTNHTSNHTHNGTHTSSNKMFNVSRFTYTIGFAFLWVGVMLYYVLLCVDRARKSKSLALCVLIALALAGTLMIIGVVIMGVNYKSDKDFKNLVNYDLKLAWSFYVAAVACAFTLFSAIASVYNLHSMRTSVVPYQNVQSEA